MLTRRKLFRDAAALMTGMLVTNSRVSEGSNRGAQPRSAIGSGPVVVGGRRVKTIDMHAHCEIPGIREMMGGKTSTDGGQIIGPERLRQMDDQRLDVAVLSINPFWYDVDRDLAQKLIRAQNEGLADICRKYPDRFVGLATVALQHPDLAAEQLEEGVTKLGLRGGSIGTSVGSDELASSKFDPFWAKAEQLGVPVFMHPRGIPELERRFEGNGALGNVIGNPLATTIALSHLIFEGTFDRFPRLRLCAAHGGGYLPSYADRTDYGCGTRPEQCTKTTGKRPTEYLKQLYFDSIVFTSEALRHLVAVCGASQIVLGTDLPFPWTATPHDARVPRYQPVDLVLGTPGLSDAERIGILGGNAARLLNMAS